MEKKKRLIDANALIAEYDRAHIGEPGNARKLMEDAPTVDAVEVVRCGACKDWLEIAETGGAGYCCHPCWVIAGEQPPIVQFADFCSYGERKDNGTEKE